MIKIITTFLILSISLLAQTTYEIINIGPGGVSDISKNGEYVCGMNYPSPAFVWNALSGRVGLSALEYSEAYDVSNNGRVVGRFYDPTLPAPGGNPTLRAAYWENGTWNRLNGIDSLPVLDEMSYTHAYGISADGTTICGMQWRPNYTVEAVRWVNGNISGLGQTYGRNSRANVVSADGSVIAGWNAGPGGSPDRTAFYWDPTPHFMGGFDSTYLVGEVGGISSDGSIIVGSSIWPFIWTASSGLRQVVADSSDYDQGYALGVSDDGTMVGWVDPVGGGFNYQAFIKKPNWADIVYLSTYISDSLGITGYSGWYFAFGQAISADGKMIGMTAYAPSGESTALLLRTNQPVPVELTAFKASFVEGNVLLDWTTSSELNNLGFVIERKIENSEWQSIGFVSGNNTTTQTLNYQFIDNSVTTNIYSYRLKQVDFDGTFEYSNVIEIDVNIVTKFTLNQNYPNPFNPSTKISFTIPQTTNVKLSIYNAIGEKIAELMNEVKSAGAYDVDFNGSELSSGMYLYRLETGEFIQTRKMSLIK